MLKALAKQIRFGLVLPHGRGEGLAHVGTVVHGELDVAIQKMPQAQTHDHEAVQTVH